MTKHVIAASLEPWVLQILADPVTKQPATIDDFDITGSGVIDACVVMRNTVGYEKWADGQRHYIEWQKRTESDYRAEIEGVRPVYDHLHLSGRILDVGGGVGTLRHFLQNAEYVSVDPFSASLKHITPAMREAYPCLSKPINFIAACAEFLPFQALSFDCVHMRSVLDHVQSPDLALFEVRRVLRPGGKLVVGLYVDGGKSGKRPLDRTIKELLRPILVAGGLARFKDHHVFHPTFLQLSNLIEGCGFNILDAYWQPQWNDQVCYITATAR